MNKVVVLLISLVLISCSYSTREMIGTYAPMDYKNTYDTIQLAEDSIYYRRVYDINKKLVLKMKGKWKVDHDIVEFEPPYFWNIDRDLVKFPELLNDTIGNGIGYIWKQSWTIQFCVGADAADLPDQGCYLKINDK